MILDLNSLQRVHYNKNFRFMDVNEILRPTTFYSFSLHVKTIEEYFDNAPGNLLLIS
jgi:hypothetical protein